MSSSQMWVAIKLLHEREVTFLQSEKALEHAVARNQIESPNTVDTDNCGLRIDVRQTLDDMRNAFATRFRGQRE